MIFFFTFMIRSTGVVDIYGHLFLYKVTQQNKDLNNTVEIIYKWHTFSMIGKQQGNAKCKSKYSKNWASKKPTVGHIVCSSEWESC